MNHEFWNEIGNLYYMCGAYEPAIHAYLRSIKSENTFGRSYSNLALAYVQTGKYIEAIKIYRRGIELLSDKKEKAATWNRLGILYRQIKEYNLAVEAYQRADLIMPQEESDTLLEVHTDTTRPLTVAMPEIDLDAILAKGNPANLQLHSSLLAEINTELELAEAYSGELGSEETIVPPDFESYSHAEECAAIEPSVSLQSEWRLACAEESPLSEPSPVLENLEKASAYSEDLNIIIPVELQGESVAKNDQPDIELENNAVVNDIQVGIESQSSAVVDDAQVGIELESDAVVDADQINVGLERDVIVDNAQVDIELQSETMVESTPIEAFQLLEVQAEPINEDEGINTIDASESTTFFESNSLSESSETVTNETGSEATQYLQVDYPLTGLSPEERRLLEDEISKCQQKTSRNPRSYILWEELGEAYKSAGQYKDAIFAFQKAISMNPTNTMCYYRLGLVFAAENKEQDAIRSFKKVLELDPRSPQAHASLASQYRKMGLEEIAQEHIAKARAMQVEGESDYNNACLEAIFGNNERALELLEVALQSKQTYVTWAQNDPDFYSLHNDHRFQVLLETHAFADGDKKFV